MNSATECPYCDVIAYIAYIMYIGYADASFSKGTPTLAAVQLTLHIGSHALGIGPIRRAESEAKKYSPDMHANDCSPEAKRADYQPY